MFYGYGYYKKSNTMVRLEEKIKMGRYQDALSNIQQLENSLPFRILNKIEKEDPVIAYNKGVLYTLMENREKSERRVQKGYGNK